MNQIEKLIEELCPNGVEYKPLGEVTQIYRGKRFVKADMQESGVPCMHYGEIYTKYGTSATESISYLSKVRAKSLRFAQPNDVVMATAGETIEDIGKSVAWLGNEPIVIHDACYVISGKFDPKFAAYYFNSRAFKDQIRNKISSSKISSISTKNVAKTLFPILPIHIQEEISETLELFEKLEAELEARKKQYEFYRDQLLTFTESERVRWVTLNEVAQRVSSGGTPRSGTKEFYNGSIPWLRTQDIDYRDVYKTSVSITEAGLNSSSAKWVPENSVIVAMYGATAAKVAVNKIPLTTNQACCNITVDSNIAHYRYVYHWIAKQYFILKNLGEGSQNNLNARKIKNFPIPIPPLEEQQRIVNILDKFDALVNDLTSGLPAEIEARRQQYEYYRDQLLTFKELSA